MQAVPPPQAVTTSSFPTLIPGPFILLLALPAVPLLLFSIGARPPDTSNLPFSTDDLWQTTAFITVSGAVVLCLGLWPGALGEVGSWITGNVAESGGFVKGLWGSKSVERPVIPLDSRYATIGGPPRQYPPISGYGQYAGYPSQGGSPAPAAPGCLYPRNPLYPPAILGSPGKLPFISIDPADEAQARNTPPSRPNT